MIIEIFLISKLINICNSCTTSCFRCEDVHFGGHRQHIFFIRSELYYEQSNCVRLPDVDHRVNTNKYNLHDDTVGGCSKCLTSLQITYSDNQSPVENNELQAQKIKIIKGCSQSYVGDDLNCKWNKDSNIYTVNCERYCASNLCNFENVFDLFLRNDVKKVVPHCEKCRFKIKNHGEIEFDNCKRKEIEYCFGLCFNTTSINLDNTLEFKKGCIKEVDTSNLKYNKGIQINNGLWIYSVCNAYIFKTCNSNMKPVITIFENELKTSHIFDYVTKHLNRTKQCLFCNTKRHVNGTPSYCEQGRKVNKFNTIICGTRCFTRFRLENENVYTIRGCQSSIMKDYYKNQVNMLKNKKIQKLYHCNDCFTTCTPRNILCNTKHFVIIDMPPHNFRNTKYESDVYQVKKVAQFNPFKNARQVLRNEIGRPNHMLRCVSACQSVRLPKRFSVISDQEAEELVNKEVEDINNKLSDSYIEKELYEIKHKYSLIKIDFIHDYDNADNTKKKDVKASYQEIFNKEMNSIKDKRIKLDDQDNKDSKINKEILKIKYTEMINTTEQFLNYIERHNLTKKLKHDNSPLQTAKIIKNQIETFLDEISQKITVMQNVKEIISKYEPYIVGNNLLLNNDDAQQIEHLEIGKQAIIEQFLINNKQLREEWKENYRKLLILENDAKKAEYDSIDAINKDIEKDKNVIDAIEQNIKSIENEFESEMFTYNKKVETFLKQEKSKIKKLTKSKTKDNIEQIDQYKEKLSELEIKKTEITNKIMKKSTPKNTKALVLLDEEITQLKSQINTLRVSVQHSLEEEMIHLMKYNIIVNEEIYQQFDVNTEKRIIDGIIADRGGIEEIEKSHKQTQIIIKQTHKENEIKLNAKKLEIENEIKKVNDKITFAKMKKQGSKEKHIEKLEKLKNEMQEIEQTKENLNEETEKHLSRNDKNVYLRELDEQEIKLSSLKNSHELAIQTMEANLNKFKTQESNAMSTMKNANGSLTREMKSQTLSKQNQIYQDTRKNIQKITEEIEEEYIQYAKDRAYIIDAGKPISFTRDIDKISALSIKAKLTYYQKTKLKWNKFVLKSKNLYANHKVPIVIGTGILVIGSVGGLLIGLLTTDNDIQAMDEIVPIEANERNDLKYVNNEHTIYNTTNMSVTNKVKNIEIKKKEYPTENKVIKPTGVINENTEKDVLEKKKNGILNEKGEPDYKFYITIGTSGFVILVLGFIAYRNVLQKKTVKEKDFEESSLAFENSDSDFTM